MIGLQGLRRAPFGRTEVIAVVVAVFEAAGSGLAQAQGLLDRIPSVPGDWTITLGVQSRVAPEYEGTKKLDITPLPVFGIRRAGKTARFRAPLDGPSIALIEYGGFYFGPTGKFKPARREKDAPEQLRGLGDVDWSIEAGAFVEFWPTDWLRTRAELRHGFAGHKGVVADLSADAVLPFGDRWVLSGGPRVSLADTKATAPYFAINDTQSLTSGLPGFDAKGGLRSVGAGIQAVYQWTPQWEVRGYAEYSRLMGDAADSPLVVQRGDRNQITFGLGVSYAFDIKLW